MAIVDIPAPLPDKPGWSRRQFFPVILSFDIPGSLFAHRPGLFGVREHQIILSAREVGSGHRLKPVFPMLDYFSQASGIGHDHRRPGGHRFLMLQSQTVHIDLGKLPRTPPEESIPGLIINEPGKVAFIVNTELSGFGVEMFGIGPLPGDPQISLSDPPREFLAPPLKVDPVLSRSPADRH